LLKLNASGACHRLALSEGQKENKWKNKPFHNKMEVKRKMAKKTKRKILFVTAILMLMFSSVYAFLMPKANAEEPTVQDKTLTILKDVVGINTEEYAITSNSQLNKQYNNLPQKEADFNLVSNQSSLRVRCSFVNNMLRQIYLSGYKGELAVEKSATETSDMAKSFLQQYQNYAADSFYGELRSMLYNIDVSTNITKSTGNVKLEVINHDQTIIDYVWTYTDKNGIAAKSKNVLLSYDRGQLKVFLNNWPLYEVVGTPILSAEEATEIALEASKHFSYQASTDNGTITVTGFKINPESLGHATLSYLNFPNQSLARGSDPFTLYPSWYVPLGFDKSYPGSVTGMTVTIWADTGEVSSTGPMIVYFSSSISTEEEAPTTSPDIAATTDEFNQESITLSAPIAITVVLSVAGVSLVSRKKFSKLAGRKRFSIAWGILLSGIVLSTAMLAVTPFVNASIPTPNSKSRIYAALYGTPYQIPTEISAANYVCNKIDDAFEYAGYSSDNMYGSGTTRSNVMDNAWSDQYGYLRTAVFHFGHQYTPNYGYQDNTGNEITWLDIGSNTGLGKHFFVFIWVCQQACGRHYGIPANWTQNPDMSSDGYTNPDGSGQCYIGFNGFSPQIGNETGTFEEEFTYPMKLFIESFYNYTLRTGYSVKDALNQATLDYFGESFSAGMLKNGYWAWYGAEGDEEHDPDFYWGQMRVFGDGNIHLNQYDFTIVAKDQYNNVFSNKDAYMDLPYNIANTGTSMKVTGGDHTFYVGDFWETVSGQCTGYRYYFDYWQPEPGWQIYYQPLEWDFDESFTMTAYFDKQYCPGDVDGDGDRDIDDLNMFYEHFGTMRGDWSFNYVSTCDFDSDGDVDVTDKYYLLGLFNTAVYHLDEGEGSTAYDSTIYENDGTVYGATWTEGVLDSALSFDGTDDYVEVYPFDYDSKEITAMFWMKTSDTTKYGTPISCSSGTQHNEFLIYNYKSFGIYIKGSSVTTGISANDGEWHHIAVTWRSSDGLVKLYKDGVPAYTGTLQSGATINLANLVIGQEQDSFRGGFDSGQAFKGIIDEVRIYDRMLSANEIANHAIQLWVEGYCDDFPYFYPEAADVYIDDEYAGHLDQTFNLSPGQHTIEVTSEFQYGYFYYEFQYYVFDGNTYYSNPLTFTINSTKTIEAHYYEMWW
jgi:hypothetical protein